MNKLTRIVLTTLATAGIATGVNADSNYIHPKVNGKPYEKATLREITTQTYPLVSTFKVTGHEKNGELLEAVNVSDKDDIVYIENDGYTVGDVIVVLFKNDNSEIAGTSKLAISQDLDKIWFKGANHNEK